MYNLNILQFCQLYLNKAEILKKKLSFKTLFKLSKIFQIWTKIHT